MRIHISIDIWACSCLRCMWVYVSGPYKVYGCRGSGCHCTADLSLRRCRFRPEKKTKNIVELREHLQKHLKKDNRTDRVLQDWKSFYLCRILFVSHFLKGCTTLVTRKCRKYIIHYNWFGFERIVWLCAIVQLFFQPSENDLFLKA